MIPPERRSPGGDQTTGGDLQDTAQASGSDYSSTVPGAPPKPLSDNGKAPHWMDQAAIEFGIAPRPEPARTHGLGVDWDYPDLGVDKNAPHPLEASLIDAGLLPPKDKPRPPRATAPASGGQALALATLEGLAREIEALPPQPCGRNHLLNANALRAYRVAMRDGLSWEAVTQRMIQAAEVCALTQDDGGLPAVEATLRSAQSGALAKGPADPPPEREAIAPAHQIDAPVGEAAAAAPFTEEAERQLFLARMDAKRVQLGGAFVLDIPKVPPAIWGKDAEVAWMQGESLMIAGPMGLGKTTLAGMLMRAQVGVGKPSVLDLPVKPMQRVLYLAMDRPEQARRALARQFDVTDREALDRIVVWRGPLPEDVVRQPKTLLWLAEHFEADVVYLDSVKDAALRLSDDEVGGAYNRARQHLMSAGVQLCELHHTTKRGGDGGAPKTAADIYGSTWITSGTGSILMLSGEPGDPIVGCKHVRQPMNEVGPWRLEHNQASGEISIWHSVDLVDLAKHAGADGLSARAAASQLWGGTDQPTAAQKQKARRRLRDLEEQGYVRSMVAKDGTELWYPNTAAEVS